ncbi:TPA: hypothetical protein ACX6SJ_004017, partial [Photobacterium damselae]
DKDIELVFYHDGVVANVIMKYKYNVGNKDNNSLVPTISQPEAATIKKWVLFDKLPKNKSNYKVSILK